MVRIVLIVPVIVDPITKTTALGSSPPASRIPSTGSDSIVCTIVINR